MKTIIPIRPKFGELWRVDKGFEVSIYVNKIYKFNGFNLVNYGGLIEVLKSQSM
jgi:hypothetical protein